MLLETFTQQVIAARLQVIKCSVAGMADELLGEQFDGDFRLIAAQQKIGVIVNQGAMLWVILYGGAIKRQCTGVVHGGTFNLPGEGFYHRGISGYRIVLWLPGESCQ